MPFEKSKTHSMPFAKVTSVSSSDFGASAALQTLKTTTRGVAGLANDLDVTQATLASLGKYLNAEDIRKHLVGELAEYQQLLLLWTKVAEQVRTTPKALELATSSTVAVLQEGLKKIQDQLHSLQLKLSVVLDKIIIEFPRLILQPLVHKYLKKPFPKLAADLGNLFLFKRLELRGPDIVGLKNQDGEVLGLVEPIVTTGKTLIQVLKEIEVKMRLSLKRDLDKALHSYNPKELKKWGEERVLQCGKTARMIQWTHSLEQAMKAVDPRTLQQVLTMDREQLLELVKTCRTTEEAKERMLVTQLLNTIHWTLDVTQTLVDKAVHDVQSFEWQKCFRLYWQEDDCIARCGDSAILYGYEFLGKSYTLVWTPETGNAFTHLMTSLKTNACSAIIGGSGSGKADMVVDLAKALGRFYYLVEVSRVIGTQLNIYASHCAAATYAGGFTIFNINQIDDNFALLTEMMEKIATASSMGYREFVMKRCGGLPMVLSPKFALVVCMTPMAGASEWVERNRAAFRHVHVLPPDQKLITTYTLYSYGFERGAEIAGKIVYAFAKFSHSFSKVPYYDHSIRSILNVVSLMQALRKSLAFKPLTEEQLAVRALASFIQPRLLTKDVEVFQAVIQELFPKTDISNAYDEKLINGIKAVCDKQQIVVNDALLKRVYELLELIELKGPVFVAIGHHASGKTTCCRVLITLMDQLYPQQKVQVIECRHDPNDKYEDLFYETDTAGKVKPGKLLRTLQEAREGANKWILVKGPLTQDVQDFLGDMMQGKLIINGVRVDIHPSNKVICEESDANNQLIRPSFASRCCFLSFDPSVHIVKYPSKPS